MTVLDFEVLKAWLAMENKATPEQRAHADKRFQEGLKVGREFRERMRKGEVTYEEWSETMKKLGQPHDVKDHVKDLERILKGRKE